MTDKFYSLLGLAVRAGKVSFGHDAAKQSIRCRKADFMLFTSDASGRLRDEMRGLAPALTVYELDMDSHQAALHFGKRAAVMTINDANFSDAMKKSIPAAEKKEETQCL